MPAIRGARLVGILDGSILQPSSTIKTQKADQTIEEVDNPAYNRWIEQDQHLLSYLLSSMTKEILVQVSSCEHAAEVWSAVTDMFASQSKSRILQIRSQLSREKKGDSSAAAYYSKMKSLADELAAVGRKLDDDEIIEYILNGLNADYNPFVSSMVSKENLTLSDMYAQFLAYEARLRQQASDEFRSYSSANALSRGRGRGYSRGRGRGTAGRGRGAVSGGRSNERSVPQDYDTNDDDSPVCQLCERTGHTVHDCWYRFNKKFVPPRDGGTRPFKTGQQKSASSAVPSYGVDTNWYFDSGSTDHITNDLDRITSRERYGGDEQIHAANGKGMSICHVGTSSFHTPHHDFSFNKVLHVPDSTKNLIFVHQFTTDNDVYLEFHPSFSMLRTWTRRKLCFKVDLAMAFTLYRTSFKLIMSQNLLLLGGIIV